VVVRRGRAPIAGLAEAGLAQTRRDGGFGDMKVPGELVDLAGAGAPRPDELGFGDE
jgi:hypothetical protein